MGVNPPAPAADEVISPADSAEFVTTLARGLALLAAFTPQHPSLGLSDLARACGLGKRTTYRLAATLVALDYLVQDPLTKHYSPGLRVLELGFSVLESLEVRVRARPFLDELSRLTGEFVSLGVLEGAELVLVDAVKPAGITVGVQTYIGWRVPAYLSSHGKVWLASLPHGKFVELYPNEDLEARTEWSIRTRTQLAEELAEVRVLGYAINDQQSAIGVRSVAAPVRDRSGALVGSLNLAVPTARASVDYLRSELAPLTQKFAAQLSQALGANT